MMHRMSELTELAKKHNDQQNLSKMIMDIAAYIIKSLQMSEDTTNPVYKLITLKLQLMLINVLITSIFEHQSFTR